MNFIPSVDSDTSKMGDWRLRTERLSVTWHDRPIMQPLDLELRCGKLTALVGPSGTGKSTLLLALAGLSKNFPGLKIDGTVHRIRKNIYVGLLLQKPTPFPLSIFENVALALRQRRIGLDELKDRVHEALYLAGLWSEVSCRLQESALSLSGGQQQRLSLARILALKPDVLLLDEPCSALDPLSAQVVENTIAGLKPSMAILLVTHNLAQARRLANDTYVVWGSPSGSHILESGRTETVLKNPKHDLLRQYLQAELGC